MAEIWIIMVACAGFILFVAWAILFVYCICRRYRKRELIKHDVENGQWYARNKPFGDIQFYPREDGLCQDTMKRASVKHKKPAESYSANPTSQDRAITTAAIVNEAFVYDDKDEEENKQTNGDGVCLPGEEAKPDNYPDVITAAEQSGIPDVVINTTEHAHPDDSNQLPVPEYRKTTLKEKVDKSPNVARKLELLAQHFPQVTEKSSSFKELLPVGRSSTYEDLVSVGRTSSLENLAPAFRRPVRRSGSAPSMSAKEKVMRKNKGRRKRVSRSSSLNSILETDYEDSLAMCSSMETLIKQKKIKRKRKSARDETHGEAPIFSFFTPDSAPTSEELTSPSTDESGENGEQESGSEKREEKDPDENEQSSNKSAGIENTELVVQESNTSDTQIPLSQARFGSTLEQETATLKSYASSTMGTDLGNKELDIKPALIKQVPELSASKLNNTLYTQEKAENLENLIAVSGSRIKNKSFTKLQLDKHDGKFQAHKTVSTEEKNSSIYKEKMAQETKSLMHVEVDMAGSSNERVVRTTSWAAEEGAEVEENTETINNRPEVKTSERGSDDHFKPTDLKSPIENTQESRKINSLITRFQDKETKPTTSKSHTTRQQHENTSANVVNVNNNTPINTFDGRKEQKNTEIVEQIETKRTTQENLASSKHVDGALQREILKAEIILKKEYTQLNQARKTPKEFVTQANTAFSKFAATSATNSPLASPARRRQFNKATGAGLSSVMSELLTRVTVTEYHPTQDSNPSPKSSSVLTKITNASLPNGHIPSRVCLVGNNGTLPVTGVALSSVMPELSTRISSTKNQEKEQHREDKTDLNHNAVIPEAPVFTGPLPQRKSSLPVVPDPPPFLTPSSKRKISCPAPIRLDGGPAPVTGASLMSIMPELQNRLKRISVQENT